MAETERMLKYTWLTHKSRAVGGDLRVSFWKGSLRPARRIVMKTLYQTMCLKQYSFRLWGCKLRISLEKPETGPLRQKARKDQRKRRLLQMGRCWELTYKASLSKVFLQQPKTKRSLYLPTSILR